MAKNTSKTLQLGIFVTLGLLLFIAAIYFMGNKQNFFGDSIRVHSVFKNVNGLQSGNNVRFVGVNIGTVRRITILNDTAIAVEMHIHKKNATSIRTNALSTVSSDGLVGSMIVNIIPGEGNASQKIQDGDTLQAISKIATADMLTTLNTTNENAAMLTEDLLRITNAVNKGEGLLGALIKDESMAGSVSKTLTNLEKASSSAVQTMNELQQITRSVDMDESVAGLLLKDTTATKTVKTILERLELASLEIEAMTQNLNRFSEEIHEGKGPLNYAIHDTTFVNLLDSTIKNVDKASEKLDENMKALQSNFLFRGYFKKLERQKKREEKNTTN